MGVAIDASALQKRDAVRLAPGARPVLIVLAVIVGVIIVIAIYCCIPCGDISRPRRRRIAATTTLDNPSPHGRPVSLPLTEARPAASAFNRILSTMAFAAPGGSMEVLTGDERQNDGNRDAEWVQAIQVERLHSRRDWVGGLPLERVASRDERGRAWNGDLVVERVRRSMSAHVHFGEFPNRNSSMAAVDGSRGRRGLSMRANESAATLPRYAEEDEGENRCPVYQSQQGGQQDNRTAVLLTEVPRAGRSSGEEPTNILGHDEAVAQGSAEAVDQTGEAGSQDDSNGNDIIESRQPGEEVMLGSSSQLERNVGHYAPSQPQDNAESRRLKHCRRERRMIYRMDNIAEGATMMIEEASGDGFVRGRRPEILRIQRGGRMDFEEVDLGHLERGRSLIVGGSVSGAEDRWAAPADMV